MSWPTLPAFLFCNEAKCDDNDRMFVLHTQTPRFLLEFVPGGEGECLPIDFAPEEVLAPLRAQARDFYCGEVDCQSSGSTIEASS